MIRVGTKKSPIDYLQYIPSIDNASGEVILCSVADLLSKDGIILYGFDDNISKFTESKIRLHGSVLSDTGSNITGIKISVEYFPTVKKLQLEPAYKSEIDLSTFVSIVNGLIDTTGVAFTKGPYGLNRSLYDFYSDVVYDDNGNEINVHVINLSEGSVFQKFINSDVTFVFVFNEFVQANNNVRTISATFNLILKSTDEEYRITWPENVYWANNTPPTLTTGGVDVLTFMTPNGGVSWYGTLSIPNTTSLEDPNVQ